MKTQISFHATIRDMPFIWTGSRITPENVSPVIVELDDRSAKITGEKVYGVLHTDIIEDAPGTTRRPVTVQLAPRALKFFPNLEHNHLRRTEGIATYFADTLWSVQLPQDDGTFANFAGGFALETGGVEILAVGIDSLEELGEVHDA